MSFKNLVFTSESVGEGHPDKICDQISDAILDDQLKGDKAARVACETLVKNGVVVLAGEITSNVSKDYQHLVRDVIEQIGYTDPDLGFDHKTCDILSFISQQSQDISIGVTEGEGLHKEQGAGDQGLMFGYACDDTPDLMPLPISLSHQLMLELTRQRKSGNANFLKPDAKSQVSVRYENGKPQAVQAVVVSTQHADDMPLEQLQEFVVENVVKKVIPSEFLSKETRFLINPTGRFVIGGPVGDCGLTGRKIIVDTYGGYARHGGGAFSGKDPSKVDRSASYAARYIAKNVVAAGLSTKCEVQLAYAIGVAEPVSVYVETFGTNTVPEEKITAAVNKVFDNRPRGIIESLNLLKPIYQPSAAYGHFGRRPTDEGHFPWEKTDKIEALKEAVS